MKCARPASLARIAVISAGLSAVVASGLVLTAQAKRDFSVSGVKYTYRVSGSGAEIRVRQDDLVRITFSADDIPHSFTIDEYRISKRAEPGKPVTFEFRADRAGSFPIYCNLTIDERCRREMRGTLTVEAK
jgi:heme/copper-type cytochrome/quinol oxidase subunit 2